MPAPSSHRFAPAILRAYDIRGTVGVTLFEADAWALGRSFGTRIRRGKTGSAAPRVVVGRDGRLSSPMLEAALVAGLAQSGVEVVRIGVGPSPMLYYAEAVLPGVDGAIQVTGSHNPRDDNGFKMVERHRSVHGDDVRALADMAAAGDWEAGDWEAGAGSVVAQDVMDAYVVRLMEGAGDGAYRIGWDAGNGAAGPAIEALVKRLPGEHHTLFSQVDGRFPNHHPDPTVEANLADLKQLVAQRGLDFGVAFDGDGDRIGVVDANGRTVWGDEILSLLVAPLLRELPGSAIVADVKAGNALFDRVRALGGRAVMAQTGHSRMKARMREVGAPLAGEMSGHIFFAQDFYGHDDALYAAVRLIRAVALSGRSLTELVAELPVGVSCPDIRIPVDDDAKFAVIDAIVAALRREGADVDLTDGARVTTADGWWLLRASNTQAALTARAEGRDADGLARLLAAIDARLAAAGVTSRVAAPT